MRRFLYLGAVLGAGAACAPPAQRDGEPLAAAVVQSDRGGPAAPAAATAACEITRIVDGDTIECLPGVRVRLIGMDTPEMNQAPFGRLARDTLAALIPVGTAVRLESDVEQRDRYDRVLAYVWTGDLLVNWWLVRNGWAVLATYPPNVRYVDWYVAAQDTARAERRGLWASGGFDCLPSEHRRGRC